MTVKGKTMSKEAKREAAPPGTTIESADNRRWWSLQEFAVWVPLATVGVGE